MTKNTKATCKAIGTIILGCILVFVLTVLTMPTSMFVVAACVVMCFLVAVFKALYYAFGGD